MRKLTGCVLLTLAAALWPSPARAQATVSETGWWTNRAAATPVGDGGFEVALSLGDPTSVAAVRVSLESPSLSRAVLVLMETDGGILADNATVQVCGATGAWSPADPGDRSEAPDPDCSESISRLERDPGTGQWRAEVSELLSGRPSPASLMLLPIPSESLPVDPGFQVRFSGARLEATAGPDLPAAVPRGQPQQDSRPPPVAAAGAPAPAALTQPSQPVAESPPGREEDHEDAAASEPGGIMTTAAPADGRPWGRLAFFFPLSLLAGAAAVAVRWRLGERASARD